MRRAAILLSLASCTHPIDVGGEGSGTDVDGSSEPTATEITGGWRLWETPERVMLHAIAGTSRSDIWAVGDRGVILHFDGNAA